MIYLYGVGSDIRDRNSLQIRAKSKHINQAIMRKLADVAKDKGAHKRAKAYWNTHYCLDRIITFNGRIYGPRCKNRFCTYCSGVRKAQLINKYLPILKVWEDTHLVTLTIKSVRANFLVAKIKEVSKKFIVLKNTLYKRWQRGVGIKPLGLKVLECNFNSNSGTYNPHLHLLVPNSTTAEILTQEWLRIWPPDSADQSGQIFTRVKDTEDDLINIIKYGAKITFEPGSQKISKKGKSETIYIRALDNIYAATMGIRLVDRFGFNCTIQKKQPKVSGTLVDEFQIWNYDSTSMDWISGENGNSLVAYIPELSLINSLEHEVDISLE